jgi:hypothetical protein
MVRTDWVIIKSIKLQTILILKPTHQLKDVSQSELSIKYPTPVYPLLFLPNL